MMFKTCPCFCREISSLIPSKFMSRNSKKSSVSEKISSEIKEIAERRNPFTQTGEHSTLALLENFHRQEDTKNQPETECSSGQPGERDMLRTPGQQEESNLWNFPNAQLVPCSFSVRRSEVGRSECGFRLLIDYDFQRKIQET